MNSDKDKKSRLLDFLLFPAVLLWSAGFAYLISREQSYKYGAAVFAGLYLFLFAAVTAYLALKGKKFTPDAVLTGAACLIADAALLFKNDVTALLIIFTLFWLSGSYCVKLSGANRYSPSSGYYVFDLLRCEIGIPTVEVFTPYRELLPKKGGKRLGGAVIGILCATPVLAVVAALLLSADSAFETVTKRFFGGVFSAEGAVTVIIAAVLTLFVFSAAYSFGNSLRQKSAEGKPSYAAAARKVSVSAVCGFLGSISAVYALYLLSQTVYFFGAFTGKVPKGLEMTVAEYSRRGFFEMLAVAAINLALIGLAALLTRRKEKDVAKPVRGIAVFLCLFTIVLILTVLSKMWLYIRSFGLTSSRITATAAAVVMLISFLAVFVRLITVKFPYMRVVTASAVAFALFFGFCNTDRLIAEYNTDAYLSGRLKTVDVQQLYYDTGIMGAESLLKLTKCGNKAVADNAAEKLEMMFGVADTAYNLPILKIKDGKVELCSGCFDIHDRLMLKKINAHADEYKKIVDEAMKEYETVYVYISAEKPVLGIAFYHGEITADSPKKPLERFRLYEVKVRPASFDTTISISSCVPDENSIDYAVSERGGVLELCCDKSGGYYFKAVGAPGVTKDEAEKICKGAQSYYKKAD